MKIRMTNKMKELIEEAITPKKAKINGFTVEVKQHIPIGEKIAKANAIANTLIGSDGKINESLAYMVERVQIIDTYTNIDIDEKDIYGFYDLISQTNIYEEVIKLIPEEEYGQFKDLIDLEKSQIRDRYSEGQGFGMKLISMLGEVNETFSVLADEGRLEEAGFEMEEILSKLDPEKLDYVNKFLEVTSKGE